MNTYTASITIRTSGNNTTTITDSCSATSVSEATRVLRARYPDGNVHAVCEE